MSVISLSSDSSVCSDAEITEASKSSSIFFCLNDSDDSSGFKILSAFLRFSRDSNDSIPAAKSLSKSSDFVG
jgi:hypothetical protein